MLALITAAFWIRDRTVICIGLVWAVIGLMPYGFLTYSTRIPSRQTYLASVGIAFCDRRGLPRDETTSAAPRSRDRRRLLLHNIGYLWTKKRTQFLDRAGPTEQLIALSRQTKGPIYMKCFPRPAGRRRTSGVPGYRPAIDQLIWDPAEADRAVATFCYVGPVH